ncbi:Toll/interleukin-1 receptor homology (TIR) domain superfamily [Arabidopsis suecica]|uniref:Toll/interleukin-1 receptor homology (TIR) domain superfamily n=1 Tax=Arabidopsis suecica TaxID=45249 RepID=A0A8T2HG15_ARASU|nr:Toll/interleukin-1 receptor homology (TIR) domain superfamily [Arabidopsis suecica]
MSLMASPSSFPSCNYKFNVFSSFHGPDVRKTLLSHMRKQFIFNGITMFDDQGIERSEEIAPSLKKAIRESRILIVILSKKYASSSWCLDELVEILKCKEIMGHIVMTIFYGVEPSDVRNQTGEFGIAFNETCAHKTDEERQEWSKVLNDVGNIAGEDFLRWDNEAKMIEKIARDVSDKLNATPSRDFDGMVGLEAHLREMESLLDLDYDGVKMVGISGPAGIGKTTIARALHSRLSNRFQLSCFVDNLRGNYYSGLDELRLQELFLSKVLNQNGIRVCHSGVIEDRLCKQRVLIILDDVNNIKQLMALANETTWFGPGSRIVITTENKELLQQHGIDNMYHVGFPSDEDAVKILCRYAFREKNIYHGFEIHVRRVTELCGKLPLGLCVVGASLCGKKEDEWEDVMSRLENICYRDIEEVLIVGYESLDENEQMLFLHIAVFFNNSDVDLVKIMFVDSDLNVKHGLKILESRSLIEIEISVYGERILMHRLLQLLGRKAIHKQEPWKRRILLDAPEICDVLEHAKGTRNVVGMSLDISGIDEVSISKKAFKRMPNLRFLRVYKGKGDGNDRMHIPGEMEFPRRLRLLHWEAYPSKCLPPTFNPEYLVELNMQQSQLKKLWEGTQPLKNLKKLNLSASYRLKELPDLSNATNLKDLNMNYCESLIEIPSSFSHLHKLLGLEVVGCINLQVIPAHMNLASLVQVSMDGCSRLRNIPVMSTNIKTLFIPRTAVQGVPPSVRFWSCLEHLYLSSKGDLKGLKHLPKSVMTLLINDSDIERIPDCIKDLHRLKCLNISGCRRVTTLPELPGSLTDIYAQDCESLETIFFPLNRSYKCLHLTNCFKLAQRREIIQQTLSPETALLPAREVPAEFFDHRAKGNSLTILLDSNRSYRGVRVCVVISPNQPLTENSVRNILWTHIKGQYYSLSAHPKYVGEVSKFQSEHLFVFHSDLGGFHPSEDNREIIFKFSSKSRDFEIIECGAKILPEESIKGSCESESEAFEESIKGSCESRLDELFVDGDRTDCWSWLFLCLDLSKIVKNVRSCVLGRRR